jgi:putative ABC transport system permease protein
VLTLALAGLRRHPLRALMSIGGIALAVALIFAVQLVNANLTGSYEAVKEMSGHAELEVVAHGGASLDEGLIYSVDRVDGVDASASLSETDVMLRGRGQRVAAHLVGVDQRIRPLLTDRYRSLFARASGAHSGELHLPVDLAEKLSAAPGQDVTIEAAGRSSPVRVARILSEAQAPAIAHSRIAATSLVLVQGLTGTRGGVSRILVDVENGAARAVAERLRAALGPGVSVRSTGAEVRLLGQASQLDRRSAALFSAVSLLLGGLLAYTVMHLSVTERRGEIASLRLAGVPARSLFLAVLCEAIALGAVGSALGLLLGRTAFAEVVAHTSTYLEQAFPLASAADIPASVVAVSATLGIAAPVVAALFPAWTILAVPPIVALDERAALWRGAARGRRLRWALAVLGASLLMGGAWLAQVRPQLGIAGLTGFLAGFAMLAALAAPGAVRLAARAGRRSAAIELAAAQLRAGPSRTSALAAIVTILIAALLAVGGAVRNIERGAVDLARGAFPTGLWLLPDQAQNELMTASLSADAIAAARLTPEVSDVHPYRSTFLDWRGRRVKAFAYDDGHLVSEAELVEGDPMAVRRELTRTRGALLSPDLASALGLAVGDSFQLPTARGMRRLHLSGLVTNYGWPPGVVGVGRREFVRGLGSRAVAAAELDLAPGVSPQAALVALRSLARTFGVRVETPAAAERRALETARQALGQMRRIAVVLFAVSIVAMAGIMLTTVVQRRRQLGVLRAAGLDPGQLRRSIFAEALIVLSLGSVAGVCGGIVGQFLITHFLARSAGYPAAFRPEPEAVAVALVAGFLAAIGGSAITARSARVSIGVGA